MARKKKAKKRRPQVRRRKSSVRGKIVPIAKLEKQAIYSALEVLRGDKLRAARLLGIGKTTLYRKLKEYKYKG